MSLLTVADAQARVIALATALAPEEIPLAAAAGRWAATDIAARRTQPAFDLSAMDGYAFAADGVPGPWRVVREIAAGGSPGAALGPGEAVRIFTGAPLPPGADTVLIQEEATRDGAMLGLAAPPPRLGASVRRRATDFAIGDALVAAGDRLGPARIALIAAGGHGTVVVRKRPRVALVSTGDELVPPGAVADGAQLPASNAPMLAALLGGIADVIDHGIVGDDRERLAAAFARAAADCDLLVTTGGASVGDHDLVRPALADCGASLDFWRVAMKPGKPLMAGRIGDAVLLGLPGNPVSAAVTAQLFALPVLAALGGAREPLPIARRARLAAALPATGARAEYLRGQWTAAGVAPSVSQDSAGLSALASAELLIVRPAGAAAAAAGDESEIIALA